MVEPAFVRSITLADAPRIVELSAQLGYETQIASLLPRLEKIINDPDQAVFGVEMAGQGIIGWVHIYLVWTVESEMYTEIGGLVVDRQQRKQGNGEKLMRAAESWADEHGAGIVRLRSNIVRKEAHKFYEGIGYKNLKTQYTFFKELG
jgi:GNAT superfamily N-acetyltransferase